MSYYDSGRRAGRSLPRSAGLNEGLAAYTRADYAGALREFMLLAREGDATALYHLGRMYHCGGRGVKRDHAEAVKWYRLAAEQGDRFHAFYLGRMYFEGRGIAQDLVQAHMWFGLAAARLGPGVDRDNAEINRNTIAAQMTPAQIARAEELAREFRARKPGAPPSPPPHPQATDPARNFGPERQ